jgi:hypothetical protein
MSTPRSVIAFGPSNRVTFFQAKVAHPQWSAFFSTIGPS